MALVLGTTLAAHGATVTLLDCDPNRPIATWAKGGSSTAMKVMGDVGESGIVSAIDA